MHPDRRPGAAAPAPAGGGAPPEFGVYVHVPFCSERCDYCAFVTFTDRHHLQRRYVAGVRAELARARDSGLLGAPTTVYVGGGTPSLLAPELLVELLESVGAAPGAEVTVECNPESVSAELFGALASCGVNRISLGVQSLVADVLDRLGRRTDPEQVAAAAALVGAAGIPELNVDLIYGTVGERQADWAHSLEAALGLAPAPTHVSCYALTVEKGTPLSRRPRAHPDPDRQADRYLYADAFLAEAGYGWYEVSNFARPGHECRHNRACWRSQPYLGVGCAAHSYLDGRRFSNVASIERYLERVERGAPTEATSERLEGEEAELEALGLLLRTREGVPEEALPHDPELGRLVDRAEGRAVLTAAGRLLLSEVALRLRVPVAAGGGEERW